MLTYIYELIDKLWQKVSNLIFVRFSFDIPLENLKRDSSSNHLVFALTSGGIIEWLILSSWCRKNGLGAILISNRRLILLFSKPLVFLKVIFAQTDFSEIFTGPENGPRLVFCPPRERKTLFTPTDTENLIAALYSYQKSHEDCPAFVFLPIFICWRKHLRGGSRQLMEYFLGLNSRPNFIGKIWYLVRKRTDSTVKCLEAIRFSQKESEESNRDWDDELESLESLKLARKLRRNILVAVNQEMRIVLGPRYVSPYAVKENIMKDPELFRLVTQLSSEKGVDKKKLLGEAYQYLTEIAANYSFRFIEVMYVVLTWLFGKIFEEIVVDPSQLHRLRETLKTKSAIFISCHRSHLDYMVVPGVLFVEDIVTPHIAAGVNLAFWPVGHFLRKGGAFFIRRSFRGQPLYALCLQKYIDWLITNRINIKFFIEGTRSRTGKMLPPAYGLLKMVIQPFQAGLIEDLALVPISISYDEVLEEKSYGKELSGEEKEKESTQGLVKARKLFKRNIGKVYVRFCDSLSLKEELQSKDNNQRPALELEKLAFKLCKQINDITPITPKSILASVLLSAGNKPLSRENIFLSGESMAQFVRWTKMELCIDTQVETIQEALEVHLEKLVRNGTVTQRTMGAPSFLVQGKNRINLVFYKNNSIHCFFIPAIALLALKRSPDQYLKDAFLLRNLFKFEFFFSPSQVFAKEIENCISYFSTNKPSSSVLVQLNRDLIESYLTALEVIRDLGFTIETQKTLLQMIVRIGVQRVETTNDFLSECISTQSFSNALKFLELSKVIKFSKEKEQLLVERLDWNSHAEESLTNLKSFHRLLTRI